MFYLPEPVLIALNLLKSHGFEGFIVGGCVRDLILQRIPADYDITTNAKPNQVKNTFSQYRTIDTGLKHGTVTVIIGEMQLEITTYRIDGNYTDMRHPSEVVFSGNLYDDLSRRDFTMNAIAYNPEIGIVDIFNGQDAIDTRQIVSVGNAGLRFNEDALRILRAVRFSSQLGFQINNSTSEYIHSLKHNLKNISDERLQSELNKLIMGSGVYSAITEYSDVLAEFIPEIKDSFEFEQHSKYHKYDVWIHSAVAIALSSNKKNVRLAMLFHDTGKPCCFVLDENGNGHFPRHAEKGAELAVNALKRLKYDNKTINDITILIKHHSDNFDSKKSIKKFMQKYGSSLLFDLLDVQRADSNAKADFCLKKLDNLDISEKIAREIIDSGECFSLSGLKINGYDLLELGFRGKKIGEILKNLLDAVISDNVKNNKDKLIDYVLHHEKNI